MNNPRYGAAVRLIKMMIHMSERPHTRSELMKKLGVGRKTLQRMTQAVELDLKMPIIVEYNADADKINRIVCTYRIEKQFMRRFLEMDATVIREMDNRDQREMVRMLTAEVEALRKALRLEKAKHANTQQALDMELERQARG